MIKSKKMTALLLALALVFTSTAGYAYGTTQENPSGNRTRHRPVHKAADNKAKENLEKITAPSEYKDGVYTGSAEGYSGPIKVKVTVKNGKIVGLEVLSHSETPGYYENGAKVIEKILAAGNLDVDTIAGATLTSHGILAAAANALGKSASSASSSKAKAARKASSGGGKAAPKATGESLAGKQLKDGVYTGSAQGYASTLTVEVTVQNGKIADVRFVSGQDDEPYMSNALALLPSIVKNQGTAGVDVVSGATFSSNGLINAFNNAIKKAISGDNPSSKEAPKADANSERRINELKKEIERLKKANPTSEVDEGTGPLTDGKWTGSAPGYNGNVEVTLTIKNGKIQTAILSKHTDDKPYMDKAKALLSSIVSKQQAKGIDTVSGATFSSNGILNAARQALRQARGLKTEALAGDAAQTKRLEEEIARLKKELESNASDVTGSLKDGQYTAKANGYGGSVEVTITVKGGKLTDITLGAHHEDHPYIDNASAVLQRIRDNHGTKGVDTVSGATYSSRAILNATRKAMQKAAGQEVEEVNEGANVSAGKVESLQNEIDSLKRQVEDYRRQLAKGANSLKDGTYSGKAEGRNGMITALVTVKDKKITSIQLKHREDREAAGIPYFTEAIEARLIERVIEKNGTSGVDTVSGATLSTAGALAAISDALSGQPSNEGTTTTPPKENTSEDPSSLREKVFAEAKELFRLIKSAIYGETYHAEDDSLSEDEIILKDGVYTGIGRGWFAGDESEKDKHFHRTNGPYNQIKATVTIKNGTIESVTFADNDDSPSYFDYAAEIILEQLTTSPRKSTAGIDTVSTATYSSRGILEAIDVALFKARLAAELDGDNNNESEQIKALQEENAALKAELEALKGSREESNTSSAPSSEEAHTDDAPKDAPEHSPSP